MLNDAVSTDQQASLNGDAAAATQQKYNEERDKRLNQEDAPGFVELYDHEKFQHFKSDPWAGENGPEIGATPPQEGSRVEFLIAGAGYGGLLFAVRLLQAGFKLNDIRIVDSAGGFGGTWYWNRYPGLTCDVESYIYMPLLEETGYIPTQKYTSGQELREHADRIAQKWNLDKAAWFGQRIISVHWDEANKEWLTRLEPQYGKERTPITVRSRFSILSTGFTLIPRVPDIPGIDKFENPCFHTARWDYSITGGSHAVPDLVKLKNQRVGIIGTGATAIQVIPALVPWVKELYVFQRTPSSVDYRDNRPTDMQWAREAFSKPGWQKERVENFSSFIHDYPKKPATNLVDDGWTRMPAYSALAGTPRVNCRTPEEIQKHVEYLYALDLPRQESIRRRVDETVKDPNIAAKLKPWYPSWCKRPCFHDEYLKAFNNAHVKLVDTDGRSVKEITKDGLIVGDKEYKVDILILSTGYKSPVLYSPAGRVGIDVKGRNGISLDKKWNTAVTTLHGMMSHDFPNLFWPGLNQSGGSPNFVSCIDASAVHIAKIIALAAEKQSAATQNGVHPDTYRYNFLVEATAAGEEEWAQRIVSQAGVFAATAGCTPSYFNAEGEFLRHASPEEQLTRARGAVWAKGSLDFIDVLADWRASEKLEGLEITPIS